MPVVNFLRAIDALYDRLLGETSAYYAPRILPPPRRESDGQHRRGGRCVRLRRPIRGSARDCNLACAPPPPFAESARRNWFWPRTRTGIVADRSPNRPVGRPFGSASETQ